MKYLKVFLDFLRRPEWVAAVALLVQAAILALQARILHKHGETMEKHAGIAKTQAETAALIGQALNQQGQVVEEQTKIMEKQLRFQRKVEAQAERGRIFDVVLELRAKTVALKNVLSTSPSPGSMPSQGIRDKQDSAWHRLEDSILPCQKALITSIHLSQGERNYFLNFAQAVHALNRTSDAARDLQALEAVEDQYEDFPQKIMNAAQPPKDE